MRSDPSNKSTHLGPGVINVPEQCGLTAFLYEREKLQPYQKFSCSPWCKNKKRPSNAGRPLSTQSINSKINCLSYFGYSFKPISSKYKVTGKPALLFFRRNSVTLSFPLRSAIGILTTLQPCGMLMPLSVPLLSCMRKFWADGAYTLNDNVVYPEKTVVEGDPNCNAPH